VVNFFISIRDVKILSNIIAFVGFLFLSGCFEVKDSLKVPVANTGTASATVTWAQNRETSVNSAGGGYRVYYASAAGVATASNPNVVLVPYVSGPTAPTTATISNMPVGDWYIKVVAYSAYNPHNVIGGVKSTDSNEFKITIQ
jgi:hypothetical protein